MATAFTHVVSVLIFLLFVSAPLPLALTVVRLREEEAGRRISLPQALLIVLAVWCVVQAFVAQTLGLLHLFRFPGMLVTESLVLAAGLLLLRRHAPHPWNDRMGRVARADALQTVVLLSLSYMGLTQLWWSAAIPVINWDSWAFHMPHMADWQRTGWFTRMVQGADRPRNSYPYGWEALCTIFMTPFGEDLFVTFPNVIAWVLLGLATYLLARLYRAQPIHALASAALLLAIHYVSDPVNTMHVDLPFAALFMVSVYCGALAARTGSGVALGLCAAMIGLACATRVTGVLYVALLGAWLVLVRIRSDRAPLAAQPAARAAALWGCVVAVPLAAFWYMRNVLELGRPLGGGATRISWTWVQTKALVFTFNPLAFADWQALYARAFQELDAPFVALVAMTAVWPLAMLRARPSPKASSALELVALLIGSGGVFICTPTSAISGLQMRLGLAFLAVLAAAGAVGATRAGLHPALPSAFTVLSMSRTFEGSRMLYPLMLVGVAWGVWHGRGWLLRLTHTQAAAVVTLGLVAVTAMARIRREGERITTYGAFYPYLEQHLEPAEPVAYLMSGRPYLFYGRRLARAVVYAPLAPEQSVTDWAESLRQQGIRIVAMGPYNDGERPTAARLLAHDSPVKAIVGNGNPGMVTLFERVPSR